MLPWRRFERTAGAGAGRWWAIRVEGSRCRVRHGPSGVPLHDPAQVTEQLLEFFDEASARRAAHKKIRTKVRAGWIEVEAGASAADSADASATAIEAAIHADPSASEPWLIYADYLGQFEPVLGERVALGVARSLATEAAVQAQLNARIEELEARHARQLIGPSLATVLRERRHEGTVELERRHGMIFSARLRDRGTARLAGLLDGLLDHPSARLLGEVEVRGEEERPQDFAASVARIVAHELPWLRRLSLDGLIDAGPSHPWRGRSPNWASWVDVELPSLTELLACAPRLEQLELRGPFPSGPLVNAQLERLRLCRAQDGPSMSFEGWKLPSLRSLQLVVPRPVPSWTCAQFPALERLFIDAQGHGNQLVEELIRSDRLEGLRSLILAGAELGGRGVRLILAHAERFRAIPQLVIHDLPRPSDELAEALPHARLEVGTEGWVEWDEDPWGLALGR